MDLSEKEIREVVDLLNVLETDISEIYDSGYVGTETLKLWVGLIRQTAKSIVNDVRLASILADSGLAFYFIETHNSLSIALRNGNEVLIPL